MFLIEGIGFGAWKHRPLNWAYEAYSTPSACSFPLCLECQNTLLIQTGEIYAQSPFTDSKDFETSRWYPNRLCEGECHHYINVLKEKCPGVEIARTHSARLSIAFEYSRLSSLLVATRRSLRRGARISGLLCRLDSAGLRNLWSYFWKLYDEDVALDFKT